jgi:hypothetical protein
MNLLQIVLVPEPPTWLTFGLGLIALAILSRKHLRKKP